MRKLRIVGVDAESAQVECEVVDSGEKYTLPLDDRFRAAARGEYIAAGGAERPPVTGTMRPREIQDRIRHGASAEEVAADAGVPLSRIEGFAVPVLLERANAAEMARGAHPVLADGPSLDTLESRVGIALDMRGIDPDLVKWDAWRDRSGNWVVRTSWPAGLSDDASATWSFVPDSHGGSARALDEEAEQLLDPSRATALRTVSEPPPLPPGPPPIRAVPAPTPTEHSPADQQQPNQQQASQPPSGQQPQAEPKPQQRPQPIELNPESQRPAAPASVSPATAHHHEDARRQDEPARHQDEAASHNDAPKNSPDTESDQHPGDDFLQPTPTEPEKRSSRRHPTMPSWEDVLLGVRSKDD